MRRNISAVNKTLFLSIWGVSNKLLYCIVLYCIVLYPCHGFIPRFGLGTHIYPNSSMFVEESLLNLFQLEKNTVNPSCWKSPCQLHKYSFMERKSLCHHQKVTPLGLDSVGLLFFFSD